VFVFVRRMSTTLLIFVFVFVFVFHFLSLVFFFGAFALTCFLPFRR